MSSAHWAIIGDIHSQAHKLERAIAYCRVNNRKPLFLGDIFDSRCPTSDSFGVYKMLRVAQCELGAIILQSNHQDKLIRFLHGNKVTENYGLSRTIAEFGLRSPTPKVSRGELLDWLSEMPFGIVFVDDKGHEYRAAHAYFPSKVSTIVESREWTNFEERYTLFYETTFHEYEKKNFVPVTRKNPPKKSFRRLKDEMIYGPIGKLPDHSFHNSPRIPWWNSAESRSWTMVAGHYHIVADNKKTRSLILDGGCGDENGELALYDLDKKTIIYF